MGGLPKILVFFGAGASHGCGGLSNPPPLGKGLFNELRTRFPSSWGTINNSFRDGFEDHFEDGMEQYYNNIKATSADILLPLLKDMSRYFSTFDRIDDKEENFYCKLISNYRNRLESQEMIFATLNYDCLLEFAAAKEGIGSFSYIGTSPGLKLLKIHGSCNFLVPMTNIQIGGKFIFTDGEINYNIKPISISPSFEREVDLQLQNKTILPGIVMYAKKKRLFFAAHQMRAISQEFLNAVQSAKLIVIIGVKPNPDDQHIWDSLKICGGQIAFVGGKKTWKRWATDNRKSRNDIWLSRRFSCGFKKICDLIDNIP